MTLKSIFVVSHRSSAADAAVNSVSPVEKSGKDVLLWLGGFFFSSDGVSAMITFPESILLR
jgi:hypothetical protein